MKAKRLGRPKLAKGEARDVLIGARFTPDESKEIHAAVKQSKQEKSDWLRNVLLGAARSGSV